MYGWKGEVPETEYVIPFGEANIKRSGADVTLISFSKPVKLLMDASVELDKEGIGYRSHRI